MGEPPTRKGRKQMITYTIPGGWPVQAGRRLPRSREEISIRINGASAPDLTRLTSYVRAPWSDAQGSTRVLELARGNRDHGYNDHARETSG